jgi:hypothetical protein
MKNATLKFTTLGLVLLLSGSAFANIFENSPFHQPEPSSTCVWTGFGTIEMGKFLRDNKNVDIESRLGTANSGMRLTLTNANHVYDIVSTGTNSCKGSTPSAEIKREYYDAVNGWVVASPVYAGRYDNVPGSYRSVDICPPNENLDAIYNYTKDGALKCYDPAVLGENDTCEGGILTPASPGAKANVCLLKSDGSSCPAELSPDGKFFTTAFESGSICYEPEAPEELITTLGLMPDAEQCLGTVNDTLVCNFSDPTITNGADEFKVCGTYSSDDGQTKFVCFDKDSDGDGTVNHRDPDLGVPEVPPVTPPDTPNPIDPTVVEGESNLERNTLLGLTIDAIDEQKEEQIVTRNAINNQTGLMRQKLDAINDTLNKVPEGIPTADDITAGFDSLFDTLTDTINSGMEKGVGENCDSSGVCGNSLQSSQVDFLETAFGNFSSADCVNPVWIGQTLDFCTRAPDINRMLYWIVALITMVGIWHEVHASVRRNT